MVCDYGEEHKVTTMFFLVKMKKKKSKFIKVYRKFIYFLRTMDVYKL